MNELERLANSVNDKKGQASGLDLLTAGISLSLLRLMESREVTTEKEVSLIGKDHLASVLISS